MKSIRSRAIIGSFSSRQDGSIRGSFETPELSSTEKATFFDLQGKNVELFIVPTDEGEVEMMQVENDTDAKTPGQRLRAVLFVLWKSIEGADKADFADFYRKRMEDFINHVKTKLPEK